jgi:hypothetical protein
MTSNAEYMDDHVIATLVLPLGEWEIRADEARNAVTIRAKGPVSPRSARRLLIVDGGEI